MRIKYFRDFILIHFKNIYSKLFKYNIFSYAYINIHIHIYNISMFQLFNATLKILSSNKRTTDRIAGRKLLMLDALAAAVI